MENQRDKKEVIVISGSSGLIGTVLIHKLSSQFRIAGMDNTGYPFPPAEAECICLDITNDKSVEFAFKRIRYEYGSKIASVVHLGAYYDFSGKPSDLYDKITVKGTERFIKYLQELNFSEFGSYDSKKQYKKFEEIIEDIETDDMPLPSFLIIHRHAILSEEQKSLLINWSRRELDQIKAKYPTESFEEEQEKSEE